MEILVTHITRMRETRICVAGIELISGKHVRPIAAPGDPLTTADLRTNGGVYCLGAIVELGRGVDRPSPPEIEDHVVTRSAARLVEQESWDLVFETLTGLAQSSLRAVFGRALERDGATYSLPAGAGDQSLGIVPIPSSATLAVDSYGHVRLRAQLAGRDASLAVTDLRTWDYAAARPDRDAVSRLNAAVGRDSGTPRCTVAVRVAALAALDEPSVL